MIIKKTNMITNSILGTVGNTPTVQLSALLPEYNINLFGKIEGLNPGGSIKDRTAKNILINAIHKGEINKDTTVVESSSGNMAVGLAQVCLKLGLKLVVVVDPRINKYTHQLLKIYGAQIEMVSGNEENETFLQSRLRKVKQLRSQIENHYWPNQYANLANPMAHRQTMEEIVNDLDGKVDYLFAATSTCGTIMGCAQYVREMKLNTKIVAVDAVGSVIFSQKPGRRLIPGHGAGQPSQILNENMIDEVVHVNDRECVIGCHQLLRREAILAGGSSGAVTFAIRKMAPWIPEGSNCALILCDRGERYMDTIYSDKWVSKHFGFIDVEINENKTILHDSY